ncbi:MAG TPA: hypothetical protein VHD81_06440 [Mycobacteriales bacterium]|nr:hypothetical protein [Mycobacteriales bacterium]
MDCSDPVDGLPLWVQTDGVKVAFMPRQGGWHVDPNRPGHYLRVSGHPESGIVVLSVWRGEHCIVTHEIPTADIPDVIGLLAKALVPADDAAQATAS